MLKALHKLKLDNTLGNLESLLLDLPKEQLAKNVALWGARIILQFSLDQFRKEW